MINKAKEVANRLRERWLQSDIFTAPEIIDALIAALEAKSEPVQEPVGWWIVNKTTDEKFVTTRPDDWSNMNWEKHPLYAAPQPRQPLTEQQWQEIADITGSIITRRGKDAIEKCLGIKGGTV